jgi:hypothetical protein
VRFSPEPEKKIHTHNIKIRLLFKDDKSVIFLTRFILSTIDVKKYFAFKAQGETSCIFSGSGGKQERRVFF